MRISDWSSDVCSSDLMHLFEACLVLYETGGDPRHLARAGEIFGLFRTRFFDEELGTLREFFGPAWEGGPAFGYERLDPGHMMEWVWLLSRKRGESGKGVSGRVDIGGRRSIKNKTNK